MVYFSRLPAELVLLVARHAARHRVLRSASWVATLCLVCQSFRRVVTPILYDLISVNPATYKRLVATAELPDTPLLLTRSLVVSPQYRFHVYRDSAESFASLARALMKFTSFTGTTDSLLRIACCVGELHLRTAHLVDLTFVWKETAIAAMQPVIGRLSRLHITHGIACATSLSPSAVILASQVEYLIIDAFERRGAHIDDSVLDISRDIAPWVASASCLRRVLFRARCSHERTAHRVLQHIAEWAERQRDARIYIDDTFLPDPGSDDEPYGFLSYHWDDLDWEDAVVGDSLWLQGRQVWHPTLTPLKSLD